MTERRACDAARGKPARRASGLRCWCRASTRKPRSPRWSRDFRAALPQATVYVYDNNSTDRTVEVARAAGAVVRRETHQGKGNVVRRMFADIDADIYVLVDGDATYDAPSAPTMIARLIDERLDMVVAARVHQDDAAYRPRPRHRQPAADRLRRHGVRRDVHRHPVRLPGVLAPLREIVSGAVARLRDRDRADRACARARAAGRRDRDAVLRAPGGLGVEALDLARRLPHPAAPSSSSTARSGRCAFFSAHRHRARPRCRSGSRSRSSSHFIEYGHRAAAADRDPVDRA